MDATDYDTKVESKQLIWGMILGKYLNGAKVVVSGRPESIQQISKNTDTKCTLTLVLSPLTKDEIKNLSCQIVSCRHVKESGAETEICTKVTGFIKKTMINEI